MSGVHLNKTNSASTSLVRYEPKKPSLSVLLETGRVKKIADFVYRYALENGYLNTYKALHLGEQTLESRMIRSAMVFCPTHSAQETTKRLSNYNTVAQHLSQLTNQQLSALLATANPLSKNKEVFLVKVKGVPIFIKKIRLTDIERRNPRSTQNHFKLPPYYQYGVGSMGFGVWREIAAHEMTTQWVLNGECQNFPLMYHARALDRSILPKAPTAEQLAEREEYVKYWEGSSGVRKRAEAVDSASANVVVFMEYFPEILDKCLHVKGDNKNLCQIERELNLTIAFMKSRGFLHFDAHFHNILANNNHVYFADFGLSISREFDLAPEERAFFEKHIDYDRYYVAAELANRSIVATLGEKESESVLDDYVAPENKITYFHGPSDVASITQRYRPIAVLMGNLFQGLREQSKSTPYPEAELTREWSKLSIK